MAGEPRKALILGITGQDGALLAADLLSRGWTVYGGFRRGHATKLWRLEELGILDRIALVGISLHEPHQVMEAAQQIRPDHIYHLAGESFVADSFQQPRTVLETNVLGTLNVLEAIRICAPDTKLFFASSAEVFGRADQLLEETSPFRPTNPYALSKLSAQQLAGIYRERHKLHITCGIMFNHESPLRARNFVTRKITYHLARLRIEGGRPMQLGDLGAARDWGSAVDYVGAMPKALAQPRDYVFATGKKTTISAFLDMAATAAGFVPVFEGSGVDAVCRDARSNFVLATVSPQYFRPHDTPPLIGNPARLKADTGFAGSRDIAHVAQEMVEADLKRRKDGRIHV